MHVSFAFRVIEQGCAPVPVSGRAEFFSGLMMSAVYAVFAAFLGRSPFWLLAFMGHTCQLSKSDSGAKACACNK